MEAVTKEVGTCEEGAQTPCQTSCYHSEHGQLMKIQNSKFNSKSVSKDRSSSKGVQIKAEDRASKQYKVTKLVV